MFPSTYLYACFGISHKNTLDENGNVMPARHEDTQEHWKQQIFPNLFSFLNKAPLCLDIKPPPPPPHPAHSARFSSEDKGDPPPHVVLCFTKTVIYSLDIKTVDLYRNNIY